MAEVETIISLGVSEELNIGFKKYVPTSQISSDVLYKDSKYFRKDKKEFSLNDTGRIVEPISSNESSD